MKFLHLADIHIGKKISEYPLYEDLRYVLSQAMDLAKKEDVDAVVFAGDIYDSSAPTAEAMEFYDWMLTEFHKLHKPLLMISGNHDSTERLSVGASILKDADIFIATKVEDALTPIVVKGVNFYLLPHYRPSDVNRFFETDCKSYESATKELLSHIELSKDKPNVLVAHQSILPANEKVEASGSETSLDVDSEGSVGGSETINVGLFDAFDYLALGHIHKAQNVSPKARYAGALLKCHVKEAKASRSFTIVEMDESGLHITTRPLRLLRDLVVLEGTLEQVLAGDSHENDYVHVRLLDEQFVDAPFNKLKAKFPDCLGLEYPRLYAAHHEEEATVDVEEIDKNALFADFFERYGGRKLDEEEKRFVKALFDKEGKA